MPHLGEKEWEFYVNKKCTHAKNEVIYFQQSHISIVEHVIYGGLKGERGRKREQFATILHIL
jgi:arsenate reductase-like glutaredoxin family protein